MFVYEYDGDNTDKLICYAGAGFTYDDSIGNPTTYRGKTATWSNGRQLIAYDGNTYTYDAWGRRVSKRNGNNTAIAFAYDSNGNLISQSNGMEFLYDHTGVFAVILNGTTYFYRKNAQGDIIAILDSDGRVVVKYTYDAWGNTVTEVLDCNANVIAELNPFRYRSYYCDTETGLYFLKSRYYDPELGRFMTIDDVSYLDPDTINGLNLYAYCGNNPVMCADPSGRSAILTGLLILTSAIALGGAIFGGVSAGVAGGNVGDVIDGIGKGMLSGLVIGSSISLMIGAFYVPGGVYSVLGSTMFNYGTGVLLNSMEVIATQCNKSKSDGDSIVGIMNDVVNASFSNIHKTTLGYAQFLELPISGMKAVAKIATTLNTLHDLYTVEAMTWGMQTALRNSINALWSSKSKVGFWIGVGFNFLNLINFVYSIIDKDTSYSKWTLY